SVVAEYRGALAGRAADELFRPGGRVEHALGRPGARSGCCVALAPRHAAGVLQAHFAGDQNMNSPRRHGGHGGKERRENTLFFFSSVASVVKPIHRSFCCRSSSRTQVRSSSANVTAGSPL